MPDRRTVLAAVGTALAGCSGLEVATPTATPSPTPPPTETRVPVPDAVADALGDARFDLHISCPGAVPCFHRYARGDRPEAIVVPEPELATRSEPTVTTTTYNLAADPLVLGDPVWTGKWTDFHWPRTAAVDVPDDVVLLEPGETLERTFHLDERGDGTYAVVEEGYVGAPHDPPTVDPVGRPRRLRGETFRFGALFEAVGSDWEIPTEVDVPTERQGSTLVVDPDRPGPSELVLEASDEEEGLPLMPECIAAHPPARNAIFGLTRTDVETVRMPTDGTARWFIEEAILFPTDPGPDRTLTLGPVSFALPRDR